VAQSDVLILFRKCIHGAELDLQTLVWTRGQAFPLSLLARVKCPRCGSDRVRLVFAAPSQPVHSAPADPYNAEGPAAFAAAELRHWRDADNRI